MSFYYGDWCLNERMCDMCVSVCVFLWVKEFVCVFVCGYVYVCV